ncbi:LPS assembly lipoprotein LptE [Marinobacterium rhizophilum]|uniref:LPS-assembly lipoprotein LptE n=1 Tax=Marinobacterium rhizophilum TaxID=420402 RepID=UPI000360BBFB|nr:LPS assembly lipoprotein LptE [Marinobacterium rhizophilum]
MTVQLRLILLIATLLLSSCGFQLRGNAEVPSELRELALEMPAGRSALRLELSRTLRGNGIELAAAAPYTLKILDEKQGRRVASLNERVKADEYELRTEVRFQVTQGERFLIAPTAVRTERVYSYNADAITASNAQEALLRREMQQDISRQILRLYIAAGQP